MGKLSAFADPILDLLFPPVCLACGDEGEGKGKVLCKACDSLLVLEESAQRCRRCFAPHPSSGNSCTACRMKHLGTKKRAAAVQYEGPARALVHALKFGGQFSLAKGMASLMYLQMCRLEFPVPDLLIPVPTSFRHGLTRGYNQSELLARELSKLLQKPVSNVLRRKSQEWSQASLTGANRELLTSSSFALKAAARITDQKVLLVDDVLTTGSTLKACADTLKEGYPTEIYGLTFAAV